MEQLNDVFQRRMQDALRCAICLETVRQNMTQCINQHLVCTECKSDLKKCPTCREPFSKEKPPRLVYEMVASLPACCKHKNCPEYVNPGDDHEKYCAYKDTACKKLNCMWIGPVRDLIKHFKDVHSGVKVLTQSFTPGSITKFNPNLKKSYINPFLLYGHFSWYKIVNDPDLGMLTLTFVVVPSGKPKHDVFVKVVFTSTGPEYMCKIKLNFDPDCDFKKENVIVIPCSMLSSFIGDEGNLKYKMYISTNKLF